MRKSRFTDSQILGVLRQVEGGLAVSDVCREHVHILEMNGDSYRLKQSKRRSRNAPDDASQT